MTKVNYFNICDRNLNYSFKKELNCSQKAMTVITAIIVSIFSLGIATAPVFHALVNRFKHINLKNHPKKDKTPPSSPKTEKPLDTTKKEETFPSSPKTEKPADTTKKEETFPSSPKTEKPADTTKKEETPPAPKAPEKQEPIKLGYGEYIAFKKDKSPLTYETFEKVYRVFNKYSIGNIADVEISKNRFELIKKEIKVIDADLEMAFVPRTLYEMVFAEQCIEEDKAGNKPCYFLSSTMHRMLVPHLRTDDEELTLRLVNKIEKFRSEKKGKCWHLTYFEDEGDNLNPSVMDAAYRLNEILVSKLNPNPDGFTLAEIQEHTEKQIKYFKDHYNTEHKLEMGVDLYGIQVFGPVHSFAKHHSEYQGLSLRNERDEQILRNAVALECDKVAQNAFVLYRGAILGADAPYVKDPRVDRPYSLSFGSGPFLAFLYDVDGKAAVPYHYMRNYDAYALVVPREERENCSIYIPTTHPICQMSGKGDQFHARTKLWKGTNANEPIAGLVAQARPEHFSNLTREELIADFEKRKAKAIRLDLADAVKK